MKDIHTIEPDDLFRLKFLQGAELSPDGKIVVYAVSHADINKEKEYLTLWLLSLETGASRQLTAGLARDSNPRWSPDGKQIAFLSDRGGKRQVYLIPVDGGEARPLTSMKQGVSGGPVWSPDGKTIAFTAGPADEVFDPSKPYRLTRHVYRFDAMGYLDNVVADIYIVHAGGGEPQRLTNDACHNSMPQWSPDGREILYQATMSPDTHRALLARVRVVDLDGNVREVVGDWGYAHSAAWMPDGQRIIFAGAPFDRTPDCKDDLWVIGRQGGEPECRTASLRFQVGGFLQADMPIFWETIFAPRILVSRDGETAFVRVQEGGTVPIYRVTLTGPESWTPVVTGERFCDLLDMGNSHLLFSASTFHTPLDLLFAQADGSNERQLTQLNASLLTGWNLPTVEHLSFRSVDGARIEGWFLKPPVGEPPYPTILFIHGGPHLALGHIFYFDFQMLAGTGYAVLLVNQRGSSGYGYEFARQIVGDWGNLDYADLMAGVDYVIEKGLVDADCLGCWGASAGGFMTCWIVGHTNRFKAAVPVNPLTNWVSFYGVSDIPYYVVNEMGGLPHEIPEVYRRCSPITYAHRCSTPTLLIQGEADYRCPAEEAEQFYTALKASACIVEMVRLPGSSHTGHKSGPLDARRAQNEALLDWMNRYILEVDLNKDPTS